MYYNLVFKISISGRIDKRENKEKVHHKLIIRENKHKAQ